MELLGSGRGADRFGTTPGRGAEVVGAGAAEAAVVELLEPLELRELLDPLPLGLGAAGLIEVPGVIRCDCA
jgi:hypothetical protein